MSVGLILIIAGLVIIVIGIIFIIFKLNFSSGNKRQPPSGDNDPYEAQAGQAVAAIFNDEFREELKNRGRLHFEKIIGENAMFLQQDLQITTSQLNEYMKQEITARLQEEFKKYEQAIMDAKDLATQSINKTQAAIEETRMTLSRELADQLAKDKQRIVMNFENNMSQIINHYVLEAIGNQIDLSDQLEFILSDLEANKKAIVEDINDGA